MHQIKDLSTSNPLNNPDFDEKIETVVNALAETGWCVIEDFIEPWLWRAMAIEAQGIYRDGGFRHAGVGRKQTFRILPEVRNDRVMWLDPLAATDLQAVYLERMETLRQRINLALTLGLFGFESHYAIYPAGSFYRRHLDRFAAAAHRIVSCISYLNDDWLPGHGGALRMYQRVSVGVTGPIEPQRETYVDILPHGGSVVLFLSGEFEHEVLPATRERLSLTGWFYRRS